MIHSWSNAHASTRALENVLGSVCGRRCRDAVQAAADEAAGHTAAGPAALTALRIHRGCSVDHLAGVLGLTHSGTVRLVDRLEEDGLVRRGQGQDAARRHARAHGEGDAARDRASRPRAQTAVERVPRRASTAPSAAR